jgi:hypothetical protein
VADEGLDRDAISNLAFEECFQPTPDLVEQLAIMPEGAAAIRIGRRIGFQVADREEKLVKFSIGEDL